MRTGSGPYTYEHIEVPCVYIAVIRTVRGARVTRVGGRIGAYTGALTYAYVSRPLWSCGSLLPVLPTRPWCFFFFIRSVIPSLPRYFVWCWVRWLCSLVVVIVVTFPCICSRVYVFLLECVCRCTRSVVWWGFVDERSAGRGPRLT